jgi:2-methylcitrate dehydratase PrpD
MLEQYYKPYPVCRWAQAPIEAALALRRQHGLVPEMITGIEIETFHESVRLATNEPTNTEEAQYSTSFPVAVALVRGDVSPYDISDDALDCAQVMRLSKSIKMVENSFANSEFPLKRYAKVTIALSNGNRITSDWCEPKWDHTAPPSAKELREKFHRLTDPILGTDRAHRIEDAVENLDHSELSLLTNQILLPVPA